jgi:hypothetical protein
MATATEVIAVRRHRTFSGSFGVPCIARRDYLGVRLLLSRSRGRRSGEFTLRSWRDAQLLQSLRVDDEWLSVTRDDDLSSSRQLQSEPDARCRKQRRQESTVDLDRMLDNQEPLLDELQDDNRGPAERAIQKERPAQRPNTGRGLGAFDSA